MELLDDVEKFKGKYQTIDSNELVEDKYLHTWILGGGTTTNAVTIFDSEMASLDAKRKEKSCVLS